MTWLLGLTEIYSCSCVTIPFDRATEMADEIFLGRLIQLKEATTHQTPAEGDCTKIWSALFEVEKKWKGSNDKYVEVFQNGTSCDYQFDFPNHPYIIYASYGNVSYPDSTKSSVKLVTWLCTRNADASTYNLWRDNGFDDRKKLDIKYSEPITLLRYNFNWKWIGIAFVIYLLGIVSGMKLKKQINQS